MCATTIRDRQRSVSVGSPITHYLIDMEAHFRAAGRLAELVGICDPELARLANVAFRLASRIRTDRLAVAA